MALFLPISEPRQNPNGLGNLLSQIVIGTTGTRPDFNVEEKASIEKDTRELRQIIREMGDYLPREDPEKGKKLLSNWGYLALLDESQSKKIVVRLQKVKASPYRSMIYKRTFKDKQTSEPIRVL